MATLIDRAKPKVKEEDSSCFQTSSIGIANSETMNGWLLIIKRNLKKQNIAGKISFVRGHVRHATLKLSTKNAFC